MTHGRAEIHQLLIANDLRPSRALGQNFVADGNTVRRIVRLAGITEDRPVVERPLAGLVTRTTVPKGRKGLAQAPAGWA